MRPSPVPLVNLLRNDAFCPHKLHDSTVGISPSAPMAARHRVIGAAWHGHRLITQERTRRLRGGRQRVAVLSAVPPDMQWDWQRF